MALRGQEYPSKELIDFRYREKFHLSQKELLEEPEDVYSLNVAIMGIESRILEQQRRRAQKRIERNR